MIKICKPIILPAFLLRVVLISSFLSFFACEKFYEPDLGDVIREEEYFNDQAEYRSASMGLYALQQDLVEQLIILGELRGDLLKVTDNAERDLREIYRFNVSPTNKYVSPRGFYTLIAACNNFIRKIEINHPEVLDKEAPVSNFDRYYGEAWCMRSWAFFNAVRIYGKIPYIPTSVTGIDEIIDYVNSPKTVFDSIDIIYSSDGYYNDTIYRDTPVEIDNAFIDIPSIIDTLTRQLETYVKAVGVNHRIINGDVTWDVTVWNEYARDALMGQMYLTLGDYTRAMESFNPIVYNYEGQGNIKFGLDNKFSNNNWKNTITGIDPDEHILVLKFNKGDRQQNDLQYLFSNRIPNSYQIKPTPFAILSWEAIWNDFLLIDDPGERDMKMLDPETPGEPGDFYRGYGVSYAYSREFSNLANDEVALMLENKRIENYQEVNRIMDEVDTVVYKYSMNKSPFDHDANVIIYRASSIHLYVAEIYANWYFQTGFTVKPNIILGEKFLNDGSYQYDSRQLGVRGRVGFDDGDEYVTVDKDKIQVRDPFTNEVTGVINLAGDLVAKQQYLEERILDERVRELAFEGERFYDLMRVAKRRDDPSFLADMVAAKFKAEEAENIRSLLMDEQNWYLPFYLGNE